MFNRGLVLRVLLRGREGTLNRFSSNSVLSLAGLLFAVVLLPSSGWAATKNCPVEPAQNTPIVSGETYWGTNCVLNTTGDVDSFTFKASAGDTWSMVAGLGASPSTNICMSLYAPGSTGTPLFTNCTAWPCCGAATSATQKLALAGTYTIVITEVSDSTMAFGLSLERISPTPSDGTALTLAKNITGDVSTPTAQDAYTFYAATSGIYQITASLAANPSSNLCFSIYQPDGTVVVNGNCTAWPCCGTTASSNVTPPQTGTYVVVVYTAGNDATVSYNLEVTCFLGNCPIKPPPQPSCALKDALSYDAASGTLTMNFTLATKVAVTWNAWLTYQSTMQSLWSESLPITEPQVSVTKTQALAKTGKAGVLSTFTTPTGGITCFSWTQVATGKP
jgi:hypothetical protein